MTEGQGAAEARKRLARVVHSVQEVERVHLPCPGPLAPADSLSKNAYLASLPDNLLSGYDCAPCLVHFAQEEPGLRESKSEKMDAVISSEDGQATGRRIEGTCSFQGRFCTPLHFVEHDVLVQLSSGSGFHVSMLPPSDLPWLYTGQGTHRSYSAVPLASSQDLLASFPLLANATLFFASLQAGECLHVPAGWFFQLESNAQCTFTQFLSLPAKSASFRPTLMHQRARSGAYCAMLGEKATRKRSGSDCTSAPVEEGEQCKRMRAEESQSADEEAEPFHRRAERARRCQWRHQGWSRKLDLSCDWFSHNIGTWERVFRRLGWLQPSSCCESSPAETLTRSDAHRLNGSETHPMARSSCTPRGSRSVLEIGVWEGNSAAWLLAHIVGDGDLYCVDSFQGGDEHQGRGDMLDVERRFRSNMAMAAMARRTSAARVVMLKGKASCVLPMLLCGAGRREMLQAEDGTWSVFHGPSRPLPSTKDEKASVNADPSGGNVPWSPVQLDVVYVDGSHQAEDVLMDAVLAWTALRAGGVLIFDDYQWHSEHCVHYDGGHGGSLRPDPDPSTSEQSGAWRGEERWRDRRCFCPGRAADAFMKVHHRQAAVLHQGYQLILQKQA